MNKEKFKELAYLFLMNELEGSDKIKFENAILESDELKTEFEEIKSFFAIMAAGKPAIAEESLLFESRYALMRKIRNEQDQVTLASSFRTLIDNFLYKNYKFVFSVVFTIATGIFIGYLMFSKQPQQQLYTASEQPAGSVQVEKGLMLPEISPSNNDDRNEEKFDAIKPVIDKRRSYNPVTGKLLAASLISDPNPAFRLQTINKISEGRYVKSMGSDDKIKQALISALKGDSNPSVRREAFDVLSKYQKDELIQDAFLYVLSNDQNSGLRVRAIKALSEQKFKGQKLDDKTKTILSNKAETDKNGYVRIHAASILKEVE